MEVVLSDLAGWILVGVIGLALGAWMLSESKDLWLAAVARGFLILLAVVVMFFVVLGVVNSGYPDPTKPDPYVQHNYQPQLP
jgi:uncharacterized membrane protein YfcA